MEYLLKMIACSAVFYAGYHWLLSNEKMLVFNRFYLLAGLLLPFVIPLIEIQVAAPSEAAQSAYAVQMTDNSGDRSLEFLMMGFVWLSAAISALLLMRFGRNLMRLRRSLRQQPRSNFQGVSLVLMEKQDAIYSFLNHIFIDKAAWQKGLVEPEVLEHELAHIRQKHSWDIMLLELLTALYWFNPFLYLFKKSIKINHELLADAAVLKKFDDPRSYQLILVRRAGAQPAPALVSSFHFYTIKKRVLMLQKKSHPLRAGCKALTLLPLLALLILSVGERVYAQQEIPPPPTPVPTEPVVTALKLPEGVESLRMTGENGKTWAVLKYKNGKTVREEVSTPAQQAAFEKKYGASVIPPPPPPVKKGPRDPKMPAPPPPSDPLKESVLTPSDRKHQASAVVEKPESPQITRIAFRASPSAATSEPKVTRLVFEAGAEKVCTEK